MSHDKTVIGQRKKPISDALRKLRYIWRWELRESLKWHLKCLLVFWKLPNALRHALNALSASESLHNDTYNSLGENEGPLETAIYHLADSKLEPNSTDDDEKTAYREVYKSLYHERWMDYIPDKYLTEEESWDRAEIGYENSRMSMTGGPMCDYRPIEFHKSKYYLKKNNFKSQYAQEFGEDENGDYND